MVRPTSNSKNRRQMLAVLLVIIIIVAISFIVSAIRHANVTAPGTTPAANQDTSITKNTPEAKTFNKSAHSLSDPASMWVVVNKQRPISPHVYKPELAVPAVPLKGSASAENMHLSTAATGPLKALFEAAQTNGLKLMLSSGYRSYQYQVTVYNRIVKSEGQVSADRQSARPGYSEHQTGLSADVAPVSGHCDLSNCFGTTPEGIWVAANAYKYGFIVRYPADKTAVTGYEYEPWHIRYIGVPLATQMHDQGIETLEEFFGLGPAPAYN